ncbi:MAG: VacJ family lipoprotein [Pseudomonadota bacterium]
MSPYRWVAIVVLAGLSSACASVSGAGPVHQDPWEGFNRNMFRFNETLDRALVKPAATTYVKAVPEPVRTGLSNVLGNIADVWSVANHLLQGELRVGMEMSARVLLNTTVGLAGLMDPATSAGLPRRSEDFGQTIGRWGVASGPYLVLPLLGPSTVRDAAAVLVDRRAAPSTLASNSAAANSITALEGLATRAALLDAGELLDQIALDKYTFVRDVFLTQRREAVRGRQPSTDDIDGGAEDHHDRNPKKETQ